MQTRAVRFESHALLDVKFSSWNPFRKSSAVLLDLSLDGFKIAFVTRKTIEIGGKVTIVLPLAAFGIIAPERLVLKGIMKWFEPSTLKAGGTFQEISETEKYLVEKILLKISTPD